ncbi:MAG: hypothetical protein IJ784_01635, partial [Ruminiclostridium sp.]|nr:hypothetical protein [Ruminiclostridium sp.]
MKATRKTALIAAVLASAMAFAGCGNKTSTTTTTTTTTTTAATAAAEGADATVKTDAAAAPDDAAGFNEIPIFEDEEVGFLNVSAVYFQP